MHKSIHSTTTPSESHPRSNLKAHSCSETHHISSAVRNAATGLPRSCYHLGTWIEHESMSEVSAQDVQNVFTSLPSIQMIIPNDCQGLHNIPSQVHKTPSGVTLAIWKSSTMRVERSLFQEQKCIIIDNPFSSDQHDQQNSLC